MHAVILTGGKQYRVKAGDVLSVEKLEAGPGQKVSFSRVLLIEDDGAVHLGTPVLENALVRAEVLENYKDDKILVFKKKRRKQFRRTRGHRQQLSRIRVDGIYPDKSAMPAEEAPEAKPAPAVREKTPVPKPEPTVAAKAEAAPKKPAPKVRKPAKEARTKVAPKGKTVGKKTAAAKPAAKPKKTTKE